MTRRRKVKVRVGRKGALTILWWVGGLLITLTLVSLSRRSGTLDAAQVAEVWEWFVPTLLPTLMLVGATAYATKDSGSPTGTEGTILFGLCVAVSVVYLYLLLDAVLYVLSTTRPQESLRLSSLWLGFLQALAASLLGYFFAKPSGEKDQGKD